MRKSVSAGAHHAGGEEAAEAPDSDSSAEVPEAEPPAEAPQDGDPGPLMKWDRPMAFRSAQIRKGAQAGMLSQIILLHSHTSLCAKFVLHATNDTLRVDAWAAR